MNQAEDTRSDDDSGQQFAENGCLADPLHSLARQFCGKPDDNKAEEQLTDLHRVVSPRPLTALDINAAHLVLTSATDPQSLTYSTKAPRAVAPTLPSASRVRCVRTALPSALSRSQV